MILMQTLAKDDSPDMIAPLSALFNTSTKWRTRTGWPCGGSRSSAQIPAIRTATLSHADNSFHTPNATHCLVANHPESVPADIPADAGPAPASSKPSPSGAAQVSAPAPPTRTFSKPSPPHDNLAIPHHQAITTAAGSPCQQNQASFRPPPCA